MIHDTGAGLYACLASVDLFGMERDDLIDDLDGIITVGEFYEWPPADRSSSPDGQSSRVSRRRRGR